MMERSLSQDSDNIIDSNINIMDFITQDSCWEDFENALSNQPIVKSNPIDYGFSFHIPKDTPLSKGVGKKRKLHASKYIFDSNQNKLFVSLDIVWLMEYSVQKTPPKLKDTFFIRLYPEYTELSQKELSVERCPYHNQGQGLAERSVIFVHNVTPESYQLYNRGSGRQISVLVPFAYKKDEQKIHCSLKCYNSCVGGIERRSTVMIVSFEKRNPDDTFEVLSKQTFEFKCSACISRDCGTKRSKSTAKEEEEKSPSKDKSHEPYVKFKDEKFYMLAVNDLSSYHLLQATRDHILEKSGKRSILSCHHIESCVSKRMKSENIKDEEDTCPKISPQSEWVVMSSQGSSQGSYYCPGPISFLKNDIDEITIKRSSPI